MRLNVIVYTFGCLFFLLLFDLINVWSLEIIDEACLIDVHNSSNNERLSIIFTAERKIKEFLSAKPSQGRFRIQGWRWHTLSLIREAELLSRTAAELPTNQDSFLKATEYVININMKGLERIENEMFIPWMREKLLTIESADVQRAFLNIFEQVLSDERNASALGVSIVRARHV